MSRQVEVYLLGILRLVSKLQHSTVNYIINTCKFVIAWQLFANNYTSKLIYFENDSSKERERKVNVQTRVTSKKHLIEMTTSRSHPPELHRHLLLNPTASVPGCDAVAGRIDFQKAADKPAEKSRHRAEIWKNEKLPPTNLIPRPLARSPIKKFTRGWFKRPMTMKMFYCRRYCP